MKTIEDLSYRGWQKRNTDSFSCLNPKEKKKARSDGYKNVGWKSVQSSWRILEAIKIVSIIDKKLDKGDFTGALRHSWMETDAAINEIEKIAEYAHDSLSEINDKYNSVHEIAQKALSKYKPL
jgi:hypothetical protein